MAGYNYNPYSGNSAITQMGGTNFSMPQPQIVYGRKLINTMQNGLKVQKAV